MAGRMTIDVLEDRVLDLIIFIHGFLNEPHILYRLGEFGTGFKGSPDGIYANAIDNINDSGVRILSVDVPSGLNATTGEYTGSCIKATKTVTFGAPKTGFYKAGGPVNSGVIIVKNIGFPESLLESPPSA